MTIFVNALMFLSGVFIGIIFVSMITINGIEEEKAKAYQRGLERGRKEGSAKNRSSTLYMYPLNEKEEEKD